MFEKILNDPYVIDIYNKIHNYEELNGGWAHHNLNHVKNVTRTVESILVRLEYDENFIEEAKIAALLHDIGCIEGKKDHAQRSYEMAKTYLENKNITMKNKELVLEAIKLHSDGFDTDNIIALVLIFADKLDIKYDRLAKAGYNIDGLKEIQHIKDIIVDISNNNFTISFIAEPIINKSALENYYFIPKVFKAIESFAKVINLSYKVMLNNENWNPEFNIA